MNRLNLPVAVFTIIARRLIDHCRPMHLVSFLFRQNNQLAVAYNGTKPSLLLGVALGIVYIYRRYRNSARKKVDRRISYNSNYSPKRLGTQTETKSFVRRPWYVKKTEPVFNNNKHMSTPLRPRSRSRRRFGLPSLPKKEFIKPLVKDVDSNSITSNRKPAVRTSHQSTMITDSLLTLNESKQFQNCEGFLAENSCIDIQKDDEPHRLQPVLNLSQNCIDLISNDGDNRVKPMAATSNNSLESSILGATPKILMSENEMIDLDCKYTDKNLAELSREILYSNARRVDDDRSKISQASPMTSDMSIETYAKKPRKKRRGKFRFTYKKNRRNEPERNSSTIFSLNRTRSGRIYNTGSTETKTTSKRQPKKR